MSGKIQNINSRRIWDSRGHPTVEVDIVTSEGVIGRGRAPAGTSRGTREAIEMRDGGKPLKGKDVSQAIRIIQTKIKPRLIGKWLDATEAIDHFLVKEDGTSQKVNFGGNTLVAVS